MISASTRSGLFARRAAPGTRPMTWNPRFSQILTEATLFSKTRLKTEYLYPYPELAPPNLPSPNHLKNKEMKKKRTNFGATSK